MKNKREGNKKLQSAMEYLMTYGWAILIIAVVLGALYQLGIFNSYTFTAKAPPGACQVMRPHGPYTTSFLSLAGACNGEIPEYVGTFSGSSYMKSIMPINLSSGGSIFAWIYYQGGSGNPTIVGSSGNTPVELLISGNVLAARIYQGGTATLITSSSVVPMNRWVFVGLTFNATGMALYINKTEVYTNSLAYSGQAYTPQLGWDSNSGTDFYAGKMSNVQIYNVSLQNSMVLSLYQEGIGYVPSNLKNLVVWWQLDGNANDSSGNNNNGQPNGITFQGSWYRNYTAP